MLGWFVRTDLGHTLISGCLHKAYVSRVLPLIPEPSTGMHLPSEPVSACHFRLCVVLSVRLLGLECTIHRGRAGPIIFAL